MAQRADRQEQDPHRATLGYDQFLVSNAEIESEDESGQAAPWRERAVSRSLDTARSRAEQRVQRFIDAATELIHERGGLDFTVQDVVERSGQSLRSFYQFFDGKAHLLLAVYEESIQETATNLAAQLEVEHDPLERLRMFVVTIYEWSEPEPIDQPPRPHLTVRAMADFIFDLLTTDRQQAAGATAPLLDLLADLLSDADEAEVFAVSQPRRTAALVLQTTMFNAFGSGTRSTPDAHRERAEEMWRFCLGGLSAGT